jgi:signal transduction histidine kinase
VALPAGVDLTAYRVVQEALTNALKHAGAARATVRVSYEPHALHLSIEDDGGDGPGAAERAALGGGHGLAGMRERVELYGGSLDAGPRGEGGFSVSVRLPAGSAPRSAALTGSEAVT